MVENNPVATKLNEYLGAGKTYYEAAELLGSEGFSQSQIEDAKIILDAKGEGAPTYAPPTPSGNDVATSIGENPEAAKDLLSMSAATTETKEQPTKQSAYLFFANGIPLFNVKIKGNILWFFVAAISVFGGLYILAVHILKI